MHDGQWVGVVRGAMHAMLMCGLQGLIPYGQGGAHLQGVGGKGVCRGGLVEPGAEAGARLAQGGCCSCVCMSAPWADAPPLLARGPCTQFLRWAAGGDGPAACLCSSSGWHTAQQAGLGREKNKTFLQQTSGVADRAACHPAAPPPGMPHHGLYCRTGNG